MKVNRTEGKDGESWKRIAIDWLRFTQLMSGLQMGGGCA
jgi:hypothetical protein